MANISRIKLDETTYELKDAQAARASDLEAKQDALTAGDGIAIDNNATIRTTGIPFGVVDNTSTSTAYTVTVPGIYKLEEGVCCLVKNGKVTSESGFTLNVNGLGAKPSYSNMATGNAHTPTASTRDTTIFNINYTMLFIYTTSLHDVPTGAWICYRGYDNNTNTIGYQVRSNSHSLPASQKFYRYRLLFTSADGTHYVPANTSSSTNATASRTVNQTPIDPFGHIVYYGTTAAVEANARPAASSLWVIYTLSLGYSFNKTGAALTLDDWAPVYLKCAPQSNGSAIIDADTPYVQALPTTNDGKIYIFLGVAYSATSIELLNNHPVYYHDGTGIRIWTGKTIPTKTSELTNDSGFITSSSLNGYATESYVTTAVSNLVDSAPTTLDTLNELAAALGDDPNFATTVATQIGNKQDKPIDLTEWFQNTFTNNPPESEATAIALTSDEIAAIQDTINHTWTVQGFSATLVYGSKNNITTYYWIVTAEKGQLVVCIHITQDNKYWVEQKEVGLVSTADLATVATSGSYNDLSNKPTNVSSFTNDAGYQTKQRVYLNITISGGVPTFTDSSGNTVTHTTVKSMLDDKDSDVIFKYGNAYYSLSYAEENYYNVSVFDGESQGLRHIELSWDGSFAIDVYNNYFMFTSHPANAITSAKISQWDNAGTMFVANLTAHLDENDSLDYYTCNKTYAQLCEAIDAGRQVYLFEDEYFGVHLSLSADCRGDGYLSFSTFVLSPDGDVLRIVIDDGNHVMYRKWNVANSNEVVPVDRKINNKPLSSDITLNASDVGALPSNTHIPNDIKVGSVAGKLYRNDVNGGGNFTVKGNSGCIPNLTAGTFLVSVYAKSDTQSYTFKFNFGSVSYNLSTTNGEINDIRQITIPSNGTFSGSVLNGSVAPGTILYVVMYDYLTPVSTVGVAAVTNRYSDLDGAPIAATATPLMDGTAAVGSSSKYAKEDHVHPSDTSRAKKNGDLTEDFSAGAVVVGELTGNAQRTVSMSASYDSNDDVMTLSFGDNQQGCGLTYTFDHDGVIATTDDVDALKTFVVNITSTYNNNTETYTADKTNAEIYAAWQAKREIICTLDDDFLFHLLETPTSSSATFGGAEYDDATTRFLVEIHMSGSQQVVEVLDYTFLTDSAPCASITSAKITEWDGKMSTDYMAIKMTENNGTLSFKNYETDATLTHTQVRTLLNDKTKNFSLYFKYSRNGSDVSTYGNIQPDRQEDYWHFEHIDNYEYALCSLGWDSTNNEIYIDELIGNYFADLFQEQLVSGTNIKTINNQSLLGSGNISIVAPDEVREGKLVNGSWYAWDSISYNTTATTMSQKDAGALFIDLPTKELYRYTGSAFEKLLTGKAEKAGSENQLFTALGLYVTSYNDYTKGINIDAAYDSSTQEDTLEFSATNGSLSYTFNGNDEEIATKSDLVTPIVTVSTTGAVTQALDPNKFYDFTGSPTSLTLTLNSGTGLCIYAGKFTAGTGFTNLSFPATVKVADGAPSVEAGGVYEFSVMNNLLLLAKEGS